jgi:hypothetical protein
MFGLIMALTFTVTLGAATAGPDEIRTLLFGAIGCNIAWGLVDAVMFLSSALTERGHGFLTLRAVRAASTPEEAYRLIAGAMPPLVLSTLTDTDFEKIRQGLLRMRDLPPKAPLTRDDWLGALAVFLLVFLSTFPVAMPFVVFSDAALALRVSNLIAIVLLFACGFVLARHGGYNPWRTGLVMVVLGVVLVWIAVTLEA